jgi:hypothetical protein
MLSKRGVALLQLHLHADVCIEAGAARTLHIAMVWASMFTAVVWQSFLIIPIIKNMCALNNMECTYTTYDVSITAIWLFVGCLHRCTVPQPVPIIIIIIIIYIVFG